MSEFGEVDDRKFGQYALKTNFSGNDINAEQLANVCHRLGILEPIEPLRDVKLKTDKRNTASPITNKDSPRKSTQKKEKRTSIERKGRKSTDSAPFEHFDEKANCSGGGGGACGFGKNSYGKESWGRDSGARDLSPEPKTYRLYESLNVNSQLIDNETGGTSAMLQLASKLQVAALSALETEVIELSERLKKSEQERDLAKKRLHEAIDEKERTQRRLESVGAVHESRITEMHCVIVELNKKLKFQQENAIIEDPEPDGSRSVSELSFQEGSVYNSDMECSNFEQQSQIEPSDTKEHADERSESHYSMPAVSFNVGGQVQIQAMQEEILYLRSQMALLQSKLASMQDNLDNDGHSAKVHDSDNIRSSLNAQSNYASDDLCEIAEAANRNESIRSQTPKSKQQSRIATAQPHCDSLSTSLVVNQGQQTEERVLLMTPNKKNGETQRNNLKDAGNKCNNSKECRKDSSDHEIQRLQRSIEQLRVQSSILSLSFIESKTHCEHLYLLCSKYESNAIALNQALNLSDRTIEAYDVMLALIESKLAVLENADSAIENRKAAETVAKHLMNRLENDKNMHGNSLGPWQDASSVMCSGSNSQNVWTERDDQMLREQMSRLKGQRAAVQNTVVILESPYKDYDFSAMTKSMNSNLKIVEDTPPNVRKADLETAVLMEELLNMKETFNDMKYRSEQAEREKNLALEALIHLQAQLKESEALLLMSSKERTSYSDAEHSSSIELELVEALARESRLKAQLQAWAASLETATKSKINLNSKRSISRPE